MTENYIAIQLLNPNGLATPERKRKQFRSRNHIKMGSVPNHQWHQEWNCFRLVWQVNWKCYEPNKAMSLLRSLFDWCGLTISQRHLHFCENRYEKETRFFWINNPGQWHHLSSSVAGHEESNHALLSYFINDYHVFKYICISIVFFVDIFPTCFSTLPNMKSWVEQPRQVSVYLKNNPIRCNSKSRWMKNTGISLRTYVYKKTKFLRGRKGAHIFDPIGEQGVLVIS